MNSACDLIIRNANMIDGTGSPGTTVDVAVSGERIIAVGDLGNLEPATAIDASGLTLCPGFIDAHTHDDRALLATPDMTAKTSQGVTTVITGNCGISIAPLSGHNPVPPLNLLGEREEWKFADFDAYAESLDRHPAAINSANLTGHSTLRVGAMEALDRPATTTEIDTMCRRLADCLDQGSIGMSTGLAYPPAENAPTDEIIELARVLNSHGRLYTTHMRDEETQVLKSVDETLRIGREAEVPVVISHHKVCGRANWGRTRETLDAITDARQHQTVDLDVYPYTASSTVLLRQFADRADRILITWSKPHPEFNATDLDDVMKTMGCDIDTAIDRLQPAGAIYFQMSDEDLERVLQFDGAMIGSDGLPHDTHPHPRLWGTFPRVLGHYSRDKKLFNLETAVHRMTGVTARVFGLEDRGVIRPGAFADLVLFDADAVIDTASYESPNTPAKGIHHVWVGGQTVMSDGEHTDARPGKLLLAKGAMGGQA